MIVLLWNCRGAGSADFLRHMKDLVRSQKPSIMVVVEPKISGTRAQRVIRQLGFSNFHISDPIGYAGGIWICWEQDILTLEILTSSSQFVHALVTQSGRGTWLLTSVYASPILEVRRRLWEEF